MVVVVCLSGFGFGCRLGLQVRVLTMRPPGIEVRSPAFPRGTSFWGPRRRQVLCMGVCVGHGGSVVALCWEVRARREAAVWNLVGMFVVVLFLGWQGVGGGGVLLSGPGAYDAPEGERGPRHSLGSRLTSPSKSSETPGLSICVCVCVGYCYRAFPIDSIGIRVVQMRQR